MTASGTIADYPGARSDLSRRRWFFCSSVVIGWPVLAVLVNILPRDWLPFIFYPYLIWFMVSGFRLQSFSCPRCNEYALGKWSYQNALSRKCINCGLRFP